MVYFFLPRVVISPNSHYIRVYCFIVEQLHYLFIFVGLTKQNYSVMSKTISQATRFVAILFVVSILCGFFTSLHAQSKMSKESVGVYVGYSEEQVALYDAPNGKKIRTLSQDDYMFSVCDPKNGWWRICSNISPMEADEITVGSSVWIHYSQLSVDTRNYGGQTLSLYAEPSAKSKVVYSFNNELSLRPLEVKGKWCKVQTEDKKYTGWILEEWLCDNPVTNCC